MKAMAGVIYGPGTNCHEETIWALHEAGCKAKLIVIQDLLDSQDSLLNYQALIIPGGFSWGDHLAAGRIEGVILNSRLIEQLAALTGKVPILGICNGFQVLVETGLLPEPKPGSRQVALLQNESARFESRWVRLVFQEGSIWTKGLDGKVLRMPVAHGEGRLYNPGNLPLNIACYYTDASGQPTRRFPDSPNGSAIAGIRDSSGLIFGLMPHPERASWELQGSMDGLIIFRNLVEYLKSN